MVDRANNSKPKGTLGYPIPTVIRDGGASFPGSIVKLTGHGFLIELAMEQIRPGDRFEVDFELPGFSGLISTPVSVVKLYSQWAGGSSSGQSAPVATILRLAEMHFTPLSHDGQSRILHWLSMVNKS